MHKNLKLTHFYRKTYFNTRIFFYKQNPLRSGTFYTKSSVCKDFFIQRFYTYSHTNHFETQIFLGHKNNTEIFLHTNNYSPHAHFYQSWRRSLLWRNFLYPQKSAAWLIMIFLLVKKLDIRLEILWTQICFVGHLLPWWAFQMPIVECSKTCVIPLHCLFK